MAPLITQVMSISNSNFHVLVAFLGLHRLPVHQTSIRGIPHHLPSQHCKLPAQPKQNRPALVISQCHIRAYCRHLHRLMERICRVCQASSAHRFSIALARALLLSSSQRMAIVKIIPVRQGQALILQMAMAVLATIHHTALLLLRQIPTTGLAHLVAPRQNQPRSHLTLARLISH